LQRKGKTSARLRKDKGAGLSRDDVEARRRQT